MPDAFSVLLQRLQAAFDTVSPGADPVLRASDRADFQANGAIPLAKRLGRIPGDVVGYGLLEQGFFGPYRRYGLTDGAMGAPAD